MPNPIYANRPRHPLANGLTSPLNNGDGYYVALGFDEPNPDLGGPFHLGVDWNREAVGGTDLGEPVYAIGNAIVVSVVSDQDFSTSGFGNYVVLRHDFAEPTLYNGQIITHVHSLYAHLDSVEAMSVGQQISIGQQIGTLGSSGSSEVAHLHFEITLGDTLPTVDDGYNPAGAPSDWVDPVAFVDTWEAATQEPTLDWQVIRAGMLGALEAYKTGLEDSDGEDDPLGGVETVFGSEIRVLSADDLEIVLDPDLHRFNEAGLYIARPNNLGLFEFDQETAQGILATTSFEGVETLLLSFRGTDSHDANLGAGLPAFTDGQTFDDEGSVAFYEAFRPLIEAARQYVLDNGIERFIVSGHSLGGTMADIFTVSDSTRFEYIPGLDLSVVSVASAGFDAEIAEHLSIINYDVAEVDIKPYPFEEDEIIGLTTPDWYVGISHSLDRVSFPERDGTNNTQEAFNGQTPNSALESNIGFFDFGGTLEIELPNHNNADVDYQRFPFSKGFGLQHNSSLYFNNVQALQDSNLSDLWVAGMPIIMGHGRSFFGASWSDETAHDDGVVFPALNGTSRGDYVLGLEGNDSIRGHDGHDLILGGDGNDTLRGDTGLDHIDGGAGRDVIYGGFDNDIIWGGRDTDELYGEQGADTFVVNQADFPFMGQDLIKDYNQGDTHTYSASEGDVIDVSSIVGTLFAQGVPTSSLIKVETSRSGAVSLYVDRDGNGPADFFRGAILEGLPPGASIAVKLDPTPDSIPQFLTAPSAPGSYTISPASRSLIESNGFIDFTVTRSETTFSEAVYVSTTVDRGSANNDDYEHLLNEPLVFAAGIDTATVTINILEDGSDESLETFGLIVQSSPDQPASQYLASASFTIIDDDATGSSVTFTENNDDEWIVPTAGAEIFDGLDGTDTATLDLRSWTGGISTSTSSETRTFYSGDDSLAFTRVENYFVIGGSGDDRIYTGTGNDGILGLDGDDVIDGGAGVDVMDGGSGNDTFLNVGFGEIVAGGAGIDRVYFDVTQETSDIRINLATGEGVGGSWTGIEAISGSLGSGDDEVTIVARSQQTTHEVDGNAGEDHGIADFRGLTARVTTSTSGLNTRRYLTNSDNDDNISFTDFEHFTVYGGAGDDRLATFGGDDLIEGGVG
ncbi:peptidoglycan DD-metalloendopeptidase family protein, partial [Shimia sp. R9_3]|uniref:peptidoglycan DD-metalloendopeptidase family protein n=1 Tax=Shimia sp. R9_3 TaxID=2821113 RepID=UPI001ADD6011